MINYPKIKNSLKINLRNLKIIFLLYFLLLSAVGHSRNLIVRCNAGNNAVIPFYTDFRRRNRRILTNDTGFFRLYRIGFRLRPRSGA